MTETKLVAAGATASYYVPTSGSLGSTWTQPSFADSGWASGPTGLGYVSLVPGFAVTNYKSNLSSISSVAQAQSVIDNVSNQSWTSSETAPVINYMNTGGGGEFSSGDRPFPGMPIGTEYDCFVTKVTGRVHIPSAGNWTFGVNSDDGFSCTVNGQTFAYDGLRGPGDSFGTITFAAAGDYDLSLVCFQNYGGADLELFAAPGQKTAFDSTFRLVGDTANGGLSVQSTPFTGAGNSSAFVNAVKTNVKAAMQAANNTSLYMRITFDAPNLASLQSLTLKMQYDDGFVAYLNGVEVARRNAPTTVTWNSQAVEERTSDVQATTFENFDVSSFLNSGTTGHLMATGNVLAIQVMKSSLSRRRLARGAGVVADCHHAVGQPFLCRCPRPARRTRSTPGSPTSRSASQQGFFYQSFPLAITRRPLAPTDTANGGLSVQERLPSPAAGSSSTFVNAGEDQRASGHAGGEQHLALRADPLRCAQSGVVAEPDARRCSTTTASWPISTASRWRGGTPRPRVTWNSAAVEERTSDVQATTFETFDVSAFLNSGTTGHLTATGNVLAIQVMTSSLSDNDLLVVPELSQIVSTQLGNHFFATPTPGTANTIDTWQPDIAFSVATRVLLPVVPADDHARRPPGPASTTLWTVPRRAPRTARMYTGPITISTTATVRAVSVIRRLGRRGFDRNLRLSQRRGQPAGQSGRLSDDVGRARRPTMPWTRRSRPIRLTRTRWCRTCSRCRRCRSSPTSPTSSIRPRASTPTRPTATWKCRRRWSISTPPPARRSRSTRPCGCKGAWGATWDSRSTRSASSSRPLTVPSKLDFPLFGDGATDSFDTVTLRANFNDAWVWGQNEAQYIRDQFADETLLAMGEPASHGNYVQLYVNGLYWGVYNPTERPDTSFAAAYLGGDKDNWDAFDADQAVNSSDTTEYNELMNFNFQSGSTAAYQQVQGNNPDGTRNPNYPVLMDMNNYVDYMLMNFYIGNTDWPGHNWYMAREEDSSPTDLDSTGFKFFPWDSEMSAGLQWSYDPNINSMTGGWWSGWFATTFNSLKNNADFRMLFADHAQKFLFNGGALTTAAAQARYSGVGQRSPGGDRRRIGALGRRERHALQALRLDERPRLRAQHLAGAADQHRDPTVAERRAVPERRRAHVTASTARREIRRRVQSRRHADDHGLGVADLLHARRLRPAPARRRPQSERHPLHRSDHAHPGRRGQGPRLLRRRPGAPWPTPVST